MSYELIWEQRGVVQHYFGRVTAEEIACASAEVEEDVRFDNLLYVISDFRSCTEYVNDVEIIELLAATDGAASGSNSKAIIAIVTTMREVIEAAEQYAKTGMHPYPTRIFASMDSARQWITEITR